MAKTPLLVPYAALENLQMQIAGFSRREARPDAVGTLRLDDGHSLDVAVGAGEFPTLSSIRFLMNEGQFSRYACSRMMQLLRALT